jgi:hypothetical protein
MHEGMFYKLKWYMERILILTKSLSLPSSNTCRQEWRCGRLMRVSFNLLSDFVQWPQCILEQIHGIIELLYLA